MKLHGSDRYYVFPAYGSDFRDMSRFLDHWHESLTDRHRFWPGFSGGGVLAVSLSTPERERNRAALLNLRWHHKAVYGLVLGNEAGRELERCVSCALPESAPALAVRLGLAERVPEPTVCATAEHVDGLGSEGFLVVVPRKGRRSLKLMDRLSEWFGAFGVTVDGSSTEVPPALREAMRDWFDDPSRPMFALPMSGGEDDAAWQLAVTYYVAEHWDVQASGLDTVHFVAKIEGRPNLRKFWTSNR